MPENAATSPRTSIAGTIKTLMSPCRFVLPGIGSIDTSPMTPELKIIVLPFHDQRNCITPFRASARARKTPPEGDAKVDGGGPFVVVRLSKWIFGVRHLDMPATPERVWKVIKAST